MRFNVSFFYRRSEEKAARFEETEKTAHKGTDINEKKIT
jgi:hypothetical protein